jgi:zinc protease
LYIACFAFAATLACGGHDVAVNAHTPVAPVSSSSPASFEAFRETAPPLGLEQPFVAPELKEIRLANGVRILWARQEGSGAVGMEVLFKGTASFPSQPAGRFVWLTRSLFGGTPTRDDTTLRRELESGFAMWGTIAGEDTTGVWLRSPASEKPDKTIDVIADVVKNTQLSAATLAFQLQPLAQRARTWTEYPAFVARMMAIELLYGEGHPYASTDLAGLEKSPKADEAAMRALYDAIAQPSATTVLVVGAVDDAVLAKIKSSFGDWKKPRSTLAPVSIPAPRGVTPLPRLVVVDRPGAKQSRITVAAIGPGQVAREWPAMAIAREILGGRPSSRITAALLAKSSMWEGGTHTYLHRDVSTFTFEGSVATEHTTEMLAEIDKQLAEIRDHDVSVEELERHKALYLLEVPSMFEQSEGMLSAFSAIVADGLPLDWYAHLFASIRAVDAADIHKFATERLARDRITTVVVGDWTALKPQLTALGWGPIQVRSPSGP